MLQADRRAMLAIETATPAKGANTTTKGRFPLRSLFIAEAGGGVQMDDDGRWQLHGTAPEMYERYLVPAITSLWGTDLVNRAAPRSGERVLDLACGTGIVARLAAARVGVGRVVGIDINAGMLAVARSLSMGAASLIEWQEGSALNLPFPDETFDLIFCQLGLQFFPDRPAALGEMRRVLAQCGRIALSVFSGIEHTPATNALADALDRHVGAGASRIKRSEHALSDAQELHELLTGARFRNVAIEIAIQTIRFSSVAEYVRLQFSATPLSILLDAMDSKRTHEMLEAITREVIASLKIEETAALIYPQEAFILLANK
jgi:ubiquinone/menaquinone biosynthesis C-methylase UbiE